MGWRQADGFDDAWVVRAARRGADPRVNRVSYLGFRLAGGQSAPGNRPTGDASNLSLDAVLSKIHSVYMVGLKRCYREYLKKDASARGKVKLSLTVNETGRVVKGAAHGFASEVDECIGSQMSTWRFPIPKDKDGEATDASFEISLQFAPD